MLRLRGCTPRPALDDRSPREMSLVLVTPRFHTGCGAAWFDLYYLNVRRPVRQWKVTFDADHERLRG